jgi:uncharacterized protein YbjT (DUF2867 family)
MITVMGATGQTGGEVARRLLEAGEEVRALGRSAEGLARLRAAGATPHAGDATDAGYLTEAFRGADAAYVLYPSDPFLPGYVRAQERLGEAVAVAIRKSGVRHVVALSSLGADQATGTGFVVTLHDQERRLRAIADANVLALRPAPFFESFYPALEAIEREGVYADSVPPDVRVPMIASRDVAAGAADALIARDWTGFVTRELLGERDLTYVEVTRLIGEAIGRPELPYVQLLEDDVVEALAGAGLARDVAELQVELNRALAEGRIASREGRSPSNTTATRFEHFAIELAEAFRAAA